MPEQEVNLQTYPAKDTKHIVIPRLMSYLQRINDQETGYGFQPVSAKTLAKTELMRTLPERIVYQRERSGNTVTLSNNQYPENDIRVLKHTLQPVMARTSQEKTQYKNRVMSKNANLSKKYLDKVYHFVSAGINEYTNQVVKDISGVSENPILLSNNEYPENDIRVLKHTLQPVMARTSQEKTQYKKSDRSKNANLSKKYLDKVYHFVSAGINEYTNPVATDISGVSENPILLSNNQYPENDIRVLKHTLQPVMARTSQEKTQYKKSVRSKNANLSKKYLDNDDNLVSAGINKTNASGTLIDKTGNFSELQHLNMPDIPLFDEYNNPFVADISGVGLSDNTKTRDIIGHPLTHTEENIPKIDAMMAHIQKRNKLVYEKHEDFSKQTTDRYLATEKNNIADKSISNTHIAGSRMAKMGALAGEVTDIPNVSSNQHSIFLQHAGHVQTGMSGGFNLLSNNIVRNPSDLVLRKLAVHNKEKGLENTDKPDIIKTEITKINVEKEDIIGPNIQAKGSIDDIAIIADRVYKFLETRISIEKERRGLR
ncbi:MAG: hypothetical protein E4G94_05130 [ANME-2 cluster archaeon]|nr:MAG: hypothetical protein E4G94_05130 [ANME-2 cluster archaeon]